jgi:hypothetical protein
MANAGCGIRTLSGTAVAFLTIALAFACRAEGPKFATTSSGTALRWTSPRVVLHVVAPAPGSGIALQDLAVALGRAAGVWNDALRDCGAPRLSIAEAPLEGGRAVQDARSLVSVRDGSWCPEHARDLDECHDPQLAAITHLYPRTVPGGARDGEVAEADVVINGAHFRWSARGDPPSTSSLEALLVHELGHVLGLDHPTWDAESAPSVMDSDSMKRAHPEAARPSRREVDLVCARYASSPAEP